MHQSAAAGKTAMKIGNNAEPIWCELSTPPGWRKMRQEAPFSKCVGFVGAVASTENQSSSADRKLVPSTSTVAPLSKNGVLLFCPDSGPMSLVGCRPRNLSPMSSRDV